MRSPAHKTPENPSRSIAEAVSQRQVKGGGSGPVAQLVVDTSAFERTRNHQYLVDPSQQNVLFSSSEAKAPEPTGLYHMASDKEARTQETLRVWIPNVKFTSKTERDFISKAQNTGHLTFEKKNRFTKDESLDLRGKASSVAVADPPQGVLPATTGMFGKNDCNVFASRLQGLIAHERMVTQGGPEAQESLRNIPDVHKASKDELDVGVGDKMVHDYPDGQACKYHAAAVVAKDSSSLVTLEGHVSKDLEAPQFHIRNGVKGFVEDNDRKVVKPMFGKSRVESRGLGGKVQISPLGSVDPHRAKETSDLRMRIMRGQEDGFTVMDGTATLGQDLGTTDTDSATLREVAAQVAEDLGNMYGWSKKAIRDFARSPEAIERARIRINSQKKPTPSYIG